MHSNLIKKILVFASDVVPLKNIATSGGGLRSWQIIQGLLCKGYNVSYCIPEDRFLRRKYEKYIPQDMLNTAWTRDNQDSLVDKFSPDAIVFANPDINYLKKEYDIPLIADLHGPRIIEHELIYSDFSPQRRALLIREALENYRKIDFFTSAGKWQQHYFASWFLMAGFSIHEIKMSYMPVSLSPTLPAVNKNYQKPQFIFSGGFYPWQDPSQGLDTLSEVLKEENKGELLIFGGSHNVNEDDSNRFIKLKESLEKNSHVKFQGFQSRELLLNKYSEGYVAIELMEKNIEREIAFTTRTIEFLWAGLPVIYNNYSEISQYIKEYEAGWCVDPKDKNGIKRICREVLHNPDMVKEYSKNAQNLVQENFTWDKTIKPIGDFLENPIKLYRSQGLNDTPIPFIYAINPNRNTSEQEVYTKSTIEKLKEIYRNILLKIKYKIQVNLIYKSNKFNSAWYLEKNYDVKRAKMDPVLHYVIHGWKELRDPSPDFSTANYLLQHQSLADGPECPLYHYINNSK